MYKGFVCTLKVITTKLSVFLPPQVYTASNPNGTTTGKTFKVHLQLWDTAGQERWATYPIRVLFLLRWAPVSDTQECFVCSTVGILDGFSFQHLI